MDRTNELEEQVQRLTSEVDEMRARMARLENGTSVHQNGAEPKSRRGFLKIGAGAVLGALGMAAAKVLPAAATTGGPTVLGNPNLADAPTTIQTTGTAARVFGAMAAGFTQANLDAAGTFAGPLQGLGTTTGNIEGVDGWAQGASSWAVYGLTDAGVGVVGESNTGIGLYARRSGRIRQEGLATAGAPSYTPNLYEQVRDANGILWIHNGSGVWRRVNTLRTDNANGGGTPFKPFRLKDTRVGGGPPLPPGTVTDVQVAGTGGVGASAIPADAIAVVGNLTAAGYGGQGFLTIMPQGVSATYNPSTDPSSVNFIVGQYAIANSFVCGLNGGKLTVVVGNLPNATASHFIVDITGYIQ